MNKNEARDLLVRVLDDMEKKALEMKIQGVGVACFLDKSSKVDWIGEMKVVETPYNLKEGWNLVAIAWSKAGEVIASCANSGDPDRKKIMGELGFTGGAYAECDEYKLAFAFSGATSEEDLEVAEYGISKFKE
ncbi:MAG: hypothetical protein IJD26_00215, partial [Lachnospiraceae bacterium]|nr:hypothetical protein [Lachnospiraceae bacterium]